LNFVQPLTQILKHHVAETSTASFFSYCVPLKYSPSVDKLLRTELARGL